MTHTCCWIFSKPGELPVHRCGQPVGYRMVRDDDQNLVRQYYPLCPEHAAAAAMQSDEDDWPTGDI